MQAQTQEGAPPAMAAPPFQSLKDLPEQEYFTGGHGACKGCCGALGLRLALKVMGGNTIVVNASGCMTLLATYPHTCLKVPWIHNAIENSGASVTGIKSAYRAKGKDVNVLCWAGDGATFDIGLQSLSGACERLEKFVYVCYNNENYGNTGVQKASSTPYGAYTTTTPIGSKNRVGKTLPRKNIEGILAAHEGTYVATACISYPLDYLKKVEKAKNHNGPAFIDLLAPCPTGWGFDPSKSIEVGRMAVLTGAWMLYETENGKTTLTFKLPLKPVWEYLKLQKRFRHLQQAEIQKIQDGINRRWAELSGQEQKQDEGVQQNNDKQEGGQLK